MRVSWPVPSSPTCGGSARRARSGSRCGPPGWPAAGRSNREIAGELYVTLKAIEGHLARAYAKLGIDGRDQLPRALGSRKD